MVISFMWNKRVNLLFNEVHGKYRNSINKAYVKLFIIVKNDNNCYQSETMDGAYVW
jgi:hypothetical protein